MNSISIGPFVLSLAGIFLLASLAITLWRGRIESRRAARNLERPLWISLLVGLLTARTGYVLTHLPYYRDDPLQAFYFWQDGYLVWFGAIAAVLTAHALAEHGKYPRRHLIVPLLAGFAVWAMASWTTDSLRQATQQSMPEIALSDLDGTQVQLGGFKGKPAVVNLWATWCPPCRREMPTLTAAQQTYGNIYFAFINQGEDRSTVRRYLAAQSLAPHNVLLDPRQQLPQRFVARGLPTTLFFDANGRLIDLHLGELSRARLADYIKKLENP